METITKMNESNLALTDVRLKMCPSRNEEGERRHTKGENDLMNVYASTLNAINNDILLAEQKLKSEGHKLRSLSGLRQKKVENREEEQQQETQELQDKENALDKARQHYDVAQKRSATTPVEQLSTPKQNKPNYIKDILEILFIDALVLLSQWTMLRETLSVDALVVRSLLILGISVLTLLVKVNYRKTGEYIHKLFYCICTIMIISTVFTTVALDFFNPVSETDLNDNLFSLTETVVEQTPPTLLEKYRTNPGIPELFITFCLFMVSGWFVLKSKKNTDDKQQQEDYEENPLLRLQMEVEECQDAVSDCKNSIEDNKQEFAVELEGLKNKIIKCTEQIDETKNRIGKLTTEFNNIFNQLLGQLSNYTEAYKQHMAIDMEVVPEDVEFENITKQDIYKHFNIN